MLEICIGNNSGSDQVHISTIWTLGKKNNK